MPIPSSSIKRRLHRGLERWLQVRIVRPRDIQRVVEEEYLRRLFASYKIDCVFDIGANEGQYATMLRTEIGYSGLIVSYEPIPEAAVVLRQRSRDDPKWLVEEAAVSSSSDSGAFHVMEANQFSSLHRPSNVGSTLFESQNKVARTIEVRTVTLAAEVKRVRESHAFETPFLKMDTQGHDLSVAESAGGYLGQFMGLQSELSIQAIYDDAPSYRTSLDFYERHGFVLSAFVPNNRGHFPRLLELDCIMLNQTLLGDTGGR